ncbi:MAG: hypothetical protein Q9165_006591 [Trypethelium subeluteriae]
MAVLEQLSQYQWHFLALFLLGLVFHQYRQWARLSAFKGPLLGTFSSLWLPCAILTRKCHLKFNEVNEKYGPLARIGTNLLITNDAELLIRMSSAKSNYTKAPWYHGSRIQPGHDNVFSSDNEKFHTERKAQLVPGYSGKGNEHLTPSIDGHVQNLIHLIRSKYISTEKETRPMDLSRKAQYFTLDVITDIAYGQPLGDLVDDDDVYKYIQSTEEMLEVIIILGAMPILNDILKVQWIAELVFPSEKDQTGVGRLIAISKQLVSERFGPKAVQRRDMLGSFIEHGVPEASLVSESLLQILAGSDTSATVIRATMLYLLTNPSVYHRLQAEIDDAANEGRISRPVVTDAEARALPYLQAVIKEGLRIYPAVTGALTKVVPLEGDTVTLSATNETVFLPGGTEIGYNAWGVHRSRAVFGADADVFRPERWLIGEGPELARMLRSLELVWGYGKYQCLGRQVAMIELNKVFVELFRNFNFALCDPTKPWMSLNVGLWIQRDEWVKVTAR